MNGMNKSDIKDLAKGIYNSYTSKLDKDLLIEYLADQIFQRDQLSDDLISDIDEQIDEMKDISDDLTELLDDVDEIKSCEKILNRLDDVIEKLSVSSSFYRTEVVEE